MGSVTFTPRKTEEMLGRVKHREKLRRAWKRGKSWLLQQQTQFAGKWIEVEEIREYLQLLTNPILYFGGFYIA